jgi:hypothetical protein
MGSQLKLTNTYNLEDFLTKKFLPDAVDIKHTWVNNTCTRAIVGFVLPSTPKDDIILISLILENGNIKTVPLENKRDWYDKDLKGLQIKNESSFAYNSNGHSSLITSSEQIFSAYYSKSIYWSSEFNKNEDYNYHFNRNGKLIFAEGTKENTVTIWDAAKTAYYGPPKIKSFKVDNNLNIQCSMLSPDGTTYVCCGNYKDTYKSIVQVYNVANGALLHTFSQFDTDEDIGEVFFESIDFSPDGSDAE